ncbi:glutamate--tRNA ligase family protein [Mucilaginibacter auburnensis]|uniref:Glutamyl-tRNA synthetase n=1 Tax=Mucilaginibacter auburnensis TaxID=1457233 RepID=A0A2H9VSA5_9SPHI|nr:glutamate--tRNA ligase family protein [Mucilaginibacter auburnensis]PJJ83697.1 glutamyl-tRNA synthetase [Mucilaginibacter auburnensis]
MSNWGEKFRLTRIAPTPSGYLHLGNALSFVLTAAIAKNTNASLLLRIDDLDRDRVESRYVEDVFETLKFLNIQWQIGPGSAAEFQNQWSQLQRLELYNPALDELAKRKLVFACTCSRKQLQTPGYICKCAESSYPLNTPNSAWRLITDNEPVSINTLANGRVEFNLPSEMKNFIVRKKDGHSAYQLSSLIDDVHFGVDLIVRGEDLWPSTIAQHYLARVLDLYQFSNATFHHHQLLTVNGVDKLSKSAGSTSLQYLRAQGATSAIIYNKIGETLGLAAPCADLADISNSLLL